jgi:hypothetical protein
VLLSCWRLYLDEIFISLIVLALALSGCAVIPPRPTIDDVEPQVNSMLSTRIVLVEGRPTPFSSVLRIKNAHIESVFTEDFIATVTVVATVENTSKSRVALPIGNLLSVINGVSVFDESFCEAGTGFTIPPHEIARIGFGLRFNKNFIKTGWTHVPGKTVC